MSGRGRGGTKAGLVKNKAPAPVQITAEQILREAMERVEAEPKPPKQKITDPEELAEYRLRKRKEYEDILRRQRMNIGIWTRYAHWEASQKEFDRARSIFERALEVDYANVSLWLKYAEMEMSNRFINSARNVWDRAVTLLPRVDQFWYKYAHMEEMLGNIAGARQVFERWMKWQPDVQAWYSYVKLEMRHNHIERARDIQERFLICHTEVKSYLKYGKWAEKHISVEAAREVYERALKELGDDAKNEELLVSFAQFEQRNKEFERARYIYQFALDNVPKHRAKDLFQMYTAFEKQFGSREGVEEVILSKRRFQYEEDIKQNPHNYDVWFNYLLLEENAGDPKRVREVYARAIAQLPPVMEKRFWKRYMYLWINFAVYEELEAKDIARARQVYVECLRVIPHEQFTFGKIWVMFAEFEIRQKQLDAARKILGTALGKCPKEKLFKSYIALELEFANVDRARILYQKYLEFMPGNCYAWSKFAELEASLGEVERARSIFELAIQQPVLDMPEVLWKAYIDFEIKNKEFDKTRQLYNRLLDRTKHVKVWISCAQFEATIKKFDNARSMFNKAEKYFMEQENAKEERLMVLEAWQEFEQVHGNAASQQAIQAKMPEILKKKRLLTTEDGEEVGWEEYKEYVYPEEKSKVGGTLSILEKARQWKLQQQLKQQEEAAKAAAAGDGSDEEEGSGEEDGGGGAGNKQAEEQTGGQMEIDDAKSDGGDD